MGEVRFLWSLFACGRIRPLAEMLVIGDFLSHRFQPGTRPFVADHLQILPIFVLR